MAEMNEPTAEVLARAEEIKAAVAVIFKEAEKSIEAKHPHAYATACVLAAKQFFKEAGFGPTQQIMLVQAIAESVTFAMLPDEKGGAVFLG